jgi:hypothetical protein
LVIWETTSSVKTSVETRSNLFYFEGNGFLYVAEIIRNVDGQVGEAQLDLVALFLADESLHVVGFVGLFFIKIG